MSKPILTAYNWAPDEGRGLVRDMRARWALEEVGQPYDTRYLNWGEQKGAEHRARNPFGQVPAYEQDGPDGEKIVQWESGAIVLHIAQTWPGLLPDDPAGRAYAIDWIFAALNTVEPVVWDQVIARVVDGSQSWAKDRWPSVLERLKTRLGELAAALGDKEWLDGDFSAGDLLMVQVLRHVHEPILAEYPALAAYVARGMARPAFRRALAALQAGQTGEKPADWPR